jgi:hypothetical protein
MLSAAQESTVPTPSFASFNDFASAVGCSQTPSAARLTCLRDVPAAVIRTFVNGPSGGLYVPIVDKCVFTPHNLSQLKVPVALF